MGLNYHFPVFFVNYHFPVIEKALRVKILPLLWASPVAKSGTGDAQKSGNLGKR